MREERQNSEETLSRSPVLGGEDLNMRLCVVQNI
jgi:hypothetical protein